MEFRSICYGTYRKGTKCRCLCKGAGEIMIDFKRVFIDTSPLIYYLENSPLYMDRIKNSFADCGGKSQ